MLVCLLNQRVVGAESLRFDLCAVLEVVVQVLIYRTPLQKLPLALSYVELSQFSVLLRGFGVHQAATDQLSQFSQSVSLLQEQSCEL